MMRTRGAEGGTGRRGRYWFRITVLAAVLLIASINIHDIGDRWRPGAMAAVAAAPKGNRTGLQRHETARNERYNGTDESERCAVVPKHVPRKVFHPLRFFKGSGQPFIEQAHIYWFNYSLIRPRFLIYKKNETDEVECSFVYLHIHKNGGTTVDEQTPLSKEKFYMRRELRIGQERFDEITDARIREVYQEQQSKHAIQVYTFLRDPVGRFLSSLSQVMRRPTVVDLALCPSKSSTGEFLECVLTGMERSKNDNQTNAELPQFYVTFPEMHLMPQAYELYRQVNGLDIAVDVMDLSYLDESLRYFGVDVSEIKRGRAVTGSVHENFPHIRLTPDVLTASHIERICRLYKIDVILLREANVTETPCFDIV